LLLGLSFFFGLAFEEFYRKSGEERPGGIRTFPLLAIGGGALYLLDTQHLLPFTAGLLVLGAWLFAFYPLVRLATLVETTRRRGTEMQAAGERDLYRWMVHPAMFGSEQLLLIARKEYG